MRRAEMRKNARLYDGRPCIVTGSSRAQHKKWGSHTKFRVLFMDGEKPARAAVPEGKFKQRSKGISGAQGTYWSRVEDLVMLSDMELTRARRQAMDERTGLVRE